jgi:hypothetical protein
LTLNPPLVENQAVEMNNKGVSWGPNVKWTCEGDVDKAIKFLQVQIPTLEAMQNAGWLDQMVAKVTGQANPQLGVQSSGRRSATEMRQQQAAQSTRSSDIAMNFRYFCRNVFNFAHRLKLNYIETNQSFTDQDEKLTVSRQDLAKDNRIEVAGASDPVDATTRRTDMLTLVGTIAKMFPGVMQDPVKARWLLQKLVDAWDLAGTDILLGSDEEAQQQKKAMIAQQQQMAQAQAAGSGAPGGGQQPPGPPQNGAPPGGGLGALFGHAAA